MPKTKVGAYIDEDVWEQFDSWVREQHDGRTQNVKGLELERALESHMQEDPISRIHERLDEIDEKGDSIQEDLDRLEEQLEAIITLMRSGSE